MYYVVNASSDLPILSSRNVSIATIRSLFRAACRSALCPYVRPGFDRDDNLALLVLNHGAVRFRFPLLARGDDAMDRNGVLEARR
jgi:hypothetical protein